MISDKKKFIHVHLVKTAGSSRNEALQPYFNLDAETQPPISTLLNIMNNVIYDNPKYKNYFKFTFVRNPFDMIVSWWVERICNAGRERLVGGSSYCRDKTPEFFKQYIMAVKNYEIMYLPEVLTNQLSFITKNQSCKGPLLVDYVGRFENLKEDWIYITKRLDIPSTLPHIRKSQHKHYSFYYDDETLEMVTTIFEKDLNYFGYEFKREEL